MNLSGLNKPLFITFLITFSGITLQAKSADREVKTTNTIFVNIHAKGLNNGNSWANAYTSLQSALAKANKGNDIWIAKGIYKPGKKITDSFKLKSGVNVFGGFTGIETSLNQRNFKTNPTILSGDLNNSNSANQGDSLIIVKGANNSILDGLTIKNAFNKDGIGGGIYNLSAAPTLKNLIITDNYAADGGGGMYNVTSSPVLTNVVFSNNSTYHGGGAMYNDTNSSATLVNVIFSKNKAYYGGAIYNITNASPKLINVIFISNSANNGGAIMSDHASPVLNNVTFMNNSAVIDGSAMFNTTSSPVIKNTIFWGKSKKMIFQNNSGILKIVYSDLQNGMANISGGGSVFNFNGNKLNSANFVKAGNNITANPLFINSANPAGKDKMFMTEDDGLRIQSNSPAKNKGINTKESVTDISGITRPRGLNTDIGAYEFVE